MSGDLAALISPDGTMLLEPRGFICDSSRDRFQNRYAACIDNSLDTAFLRSRHDHACALDIVADNLVGIVRPKAIIGGNVEQVPDTPRRADHRSAVLHIAFENLARD